jgi:hypothetical protein
MRLITIIFFSFSFFICSAQDYFQASIRNGHTQNYYKVVKDHITNNYYFLGQNSGGYFNAGTLLKLNSFNQINFNANFFGPLFGEGETIHDFWTSDQGFSVTKSFNIGCDFGAGYGIVKANYNSNNQFLNADTLYYVNGSFGFSTVCGGRGPFAIKDYQTNNSIPQAPKIKFIDQNNHLIWERPDSVFNGYKLHVWQNKIFGFNTTFQDNQILFKIDSISTEIMLSGYKFYFESDSSLIYYNSSNIFRYNYSNMSNENIFSGTLPLGKIIAHTSNQFLFSEYSSNVSQLILFNFSNSQINTFNWENAKVNIMAGIIDGEKIYVCGSESAGNYKTSAFIREFDINLNTSQLVDDIEIELVKCNNYTYDVPMWPLFYVPEIKVKNTGNSIVNNFTIVCYQNQMANCGDQVVLKKIEGIELLPGESDWFEFSELFGGFPSQIAPNTYQSNANIFVSSPNNKIEGNYANNYFSGAIVITETKELTVNNFSLSPNPFHDYLELKTELNLNFAVFDISGKNIANGITHKGINKLDLSNIQNGIYILRLSSGENLKLIKN